MKLSLDADKFELDDAAHEDLVQLALDLQKQIEKEQEHAEDEHDRGYEEGRDETCDECSHKDNTIKNLETQVSEAQKKIVELESTLTPSL